MDNGEDTDETPCEEEKGLNLGSASLPLSLGCSLGSSLASSQDFRRQMKQPNKRKYEDEMEELQKLIRAKEAELKSLGNLSPEAGVGPLRELRAEKEASINKRKKIDNDLRLLNEDIKRKMGPLSRTESNLHYKNEAKIDDAIRKMECQLKTQNFRLSEERRIVAEVDKLKRSKKVLVEYFTQKKEVDKLREGSRRMRGEREYYYKTVTKLSKREEELKRSNHERKVKSEEFKKDLDQLYARKRELATDFKQSEVEYQRHVTERRHRLRKESFKKKEEERKAKDQIWQKEMLEYEAQCEPFEDEKNLCNTLISYLQKRNNSEREDMLPSPREERPDQPIGLADSLDGGKYVLLKKCEEADVDYSVGNKPRRRSKKGRKLSVTKPLAHTPQIIAQFSSLTLNAPSNVSELATSIEQLLARKRFYEEHTGHLPSLSGSFSSSGSMSGSLDSPLRERSTTWGFVEVPPAIAENQTPSDAGNSAESGFHDMSRQVSKTESSESAADTSPNDQALDDLIKQSAEYGESETSRSSSDTITPEEHLAEDVDQTNESGFQKTSQGIADSMSDNQSTHSHDNGSTESSVFGETGTKHNLHSGEQLRGSNRSNVEPGMSAKIVNYDTDFPPALRAAIGRNSDKQCCDLDESSSCQQMNTSDIREEEVKWDLGASKKTIKAEGAATSEVQTEFDEVSTDDVIDKRDETEEDGSNTSRNETGMTNVDSIGTTDETVVSDSAVEMEKLSDMDEVTHL